MANEKRLVDAVPLASGIRLSLCVFGEAQSEWQKGYSDGLEAAMNLILEARTEDATEVVHGRWKYYHKKNIAVCTNCSFERDLDANFGKAISCPNCGAKMDGE